MKTLPQIWKLINNHTDKRSMLKAIGEVWPRDSVEYARIEQAYDDSFEGHRKQWRHNGQRYFRHILGVVSILFLYCKVYDANLIIAAFLHDLAEDQPKDWTIRKIREKYGSDVASLVHSVSKPDMKPIVGFRLLTDSFIFLRVWAGGRRSMTLKLGDRLHNMLTLWGTPEHKRNKISETKFFILPMALALRVLRIELSEAIQAQQESVHIDDNKDSVVGRK